MICTGYFAKTKSYVEAGMTPISIARKTPSFFQGKEWKVFAPPLELLYKYKNGEVTEKEYITYYTNYLNNKITDNMLAKLKDWYYNKNDIVLLCYEKPEDFCHRHILGDWLGKKAMLLVSEVHIVKYKRTISL